MSITDAKFDLEKELEEWVFENIKNFFGDCILLSGFRITTPSGKHGVPDGFLFNFTRRSWWIVECELLAHGVWPHIAEQLTRFVVAGRNVNTLRQVRDKVFDQIIARNLESQVSMDLGTEPTRLLQKIELFIESVQPSIAVFIDDTNQDLTDFCDALDVPTEIFRIKKFVVNGRPEYYSPDKSAPIIITEPEEPGTTGSTIFDAVEQLGGGELVSSKLKCYKLADGRVVKVQYSKFHERHQAYWYGINPLSYAAAKEIGCSHYVFVMGTDGFAEVPIEIIDLFIPTAYATKNMDGSVRHYHVHISPPPDVVLKGYGNFEDIDIGPDFSAWG
jgi:hypothetical protein